MADNRAKIVDSRAGYEVLRRGPTAKAAEKDDSRGLTYTAASADPPVQRRRRGRIGRAGIRRTSKERREDVTGRPAVAKQEMLRLLMYMTVGAVGTAGHYATLIALVSAAGVDPVAGSACGFVVGAVINYFANHRFTFRSRKRHATTFGQFFLVALFGLGVNTGLMALLIGVGGIPYLAAQVAATGAVVLLTFVLNRAWTFREVNDD